MIWGVPFGEFLAMRSNQEHPADSCQEHRSRKYWECFCISMIGKQNTIYYQTSSSSPSSAAAASTLCSSLFWSSSSSSTSSRPCIYIHIHLYLYIYIYIFVYTWVVVACTILQHQIHPKTEPTSSCWIFPLLGPNWIAHQVGLPVMAECKEWTRGESLGRWFHSTVHRWFGGQVLRNPGIPLWKGLLLGGVLLKSKLTTQTNN